MKKKPLDVVVIGAGHAGLSISRHLALNNLKHIVLERGKIGESWLSKRWDSFKLNSANKINLLPGEENLFVDEDGFCSAKDFVLFLKNYANRFHLPVIEKAKVISVNKNIKLNTFSTSVIENGLVKKYESKTLVVASGSQNEAHIPAFADKISNRVDQLHAGEFRNSSLIKEGGVLVVGSAQSGTQIAEDLLNAGRKVFISTSKVARIPRRYRGRDILEWLIIIGFYDIQTEDIADPLLFRIRAPQVSGVGPRGHTSSLQSLGRSGAVILGKLEDLDEEDVYFDGSASSNVKFGDDFSQNIKDRIDEYIRQCRLCAPPAGTDVDDLPDENASCASALNRLNLVENDINTIIWATGFKGDFTYLKFPIINETGTPLHKNGVTDIDGLYFLGLNWLRKRKSGIIWGIREDSAFIANEIIRRL